MNQKTTPTLLTIKETAEMLKISQGHVYRIYNSWRDKGVRILKLTPNGDPRFYLSDILHLIESPK